MANTFPAGLEPAPLWAAFDLIRSIPHGSGNEEPLRQALVAWATERGLESQVDAIGNILVKVPATPGKEGVAPTLIQGHIDMVCEKNSDIDFDFDTQGIDVEMDGDWLTAMGTTLGADNGIGVAAGMALVDDADAEHGPLELLMTIEEETGMDGAFNLQPGFVTAPRMLNLDTEELGAIYVGCSGGGDVMVRFDKESVPRPEGKAMVRLDVKGLTGGHSGLDIHENRANAIKCLARVLVALGDAGIAYQPSKIDGGSKRNAVPREAGAGLCVDSADVARIMEVVAAQQADLLKEFGATDPGLVVVAEERPDCVCDSVFTPDFTTRVVRALHATPSSVIAMSRDVPGLVETSTNLGVVTTTDDVVEVVNCTRSSIGSAVESLRRSLRAIYTPAGATVEFDEAYPGWLPNMQSPLLARAKALHVDTFGVEAEIKAVHAGLECGLISEKYPSLDMISIGPDIIGAHSPDERVNVPSVQEFYRFVKAILADLD